MIINWFANFRTTQISDLIQKNIKYIQKKFFSTSLIFSNETNIY